MQAIAEEKNETSGETKYIAEFQEEYATSTNISIKLLQDVDLGEKQIFLNGNQSGEYKFALDLNGHTLSWGFRCQSSIADRTFPAVGSVAVICELSLVSTLFHRDDPGQRSCGIKDMPLLYFQKKRGPIFS